MGPKRTRGAYRKEERAELPQGLQRRLVDCAAAKYGTTEKLAKALDIPKSSAHYYHSGRLTMPISIMDRMLAIAADPELEEEVRNAAVIKDRTWANSYAANINREMCKKRLELPTVEELQSNDELRRKAAAIVSYVMAEGSIWIRDDKDGEGTVNITFADHETDLYEHFRSLCKDVFDYDIGPPQLPGNGARAIRGFIYSRFVADWLMLNGVVEGEKSAKEMRIPKWIMGSTDPHTLVAALQPWCDGEGSVCGCYGQRYNGFILVQSRHTMIDFSVLDRVIGHRGSGRNIMAGLLDLSCIHGINAIEYCRAFYDSEVIGDIKHLFDKLGLRPIKRLASIHLKDDGFYSCIWELRFRMRDTCRLLNMGMVTQERKARKIAGIGSHTRQ
ncbi:MAG: hypothetical protein IH630_04445 [Thermoplasmata archaeon]|nr:hypothetical protein [Thermoplasmata archaeon]